MNGVYSKNGSKWLDACSVDFRCIRFTSNLAQTFLRCISPRHKRKLEDIIHVEVSFGALNHYTSAGITAKSAKRHFNINEATG